MTFKCHRKILFGKVGQNNTHSFFIAKMHFSGFIEYPCYLGYIQTAIADLAWQQVQDGTRLIREKIARELTTALGHTIPTMKGFWVWIRQGPIHSRMGRLARLDARQQGTSIPSGELTGRAYFPS